MTKWPSDPSDQVTKSLSDLWPSDRVTGSFADDWPYGIFLVVLFVPINGINPTCNTSVYSKLKISIPLIELKYLCKYNFLGPGDFFVSWGLKIMIEYDLWLESYFYENNYVAKQTNNCFPFKFVSLQLCHVSLG